MNVQLMAWTCSNYYLFYHLQPFHHLNFKCDLEVQPTRTWTNVSNGTALSESDCPVHIGLLVSLSRRARDVISSQCWKKVPTSPKWPKDKSVNGDVKTQFKQTNKHMALLHLKENNCSKLFWNPFMNAEAIVRKLHLWPFILWPSS